MSTSMHGGRLAASRLRGHGVSHLFTLSGGHLFSLYDGARAEGISIVDVRHEQTAAFAAEGWAKVTRQPGVCALTAGPGVTNGLSAMGGALSNRSPMVVIGGRAPAVRWGQGSLQEVDHLPFVAPLTRSARTADGPGDIQPSLDHAFAAAQGPPGGPAFLDIALDHVFMEAEPAGPVPAPPTESPVDPGLLERASALLRGAERPVVMAGTDLYWAGAERALVTLAEAMQIPVFTNGQARGCIPADHPLAFARTRSRALNEADVALVVGVPMDFRLGFGGSFGEQTQVITLQRAPFDAQPPRAAQLALVGDIAAALSDLHAGGLRPPAGAAGRLAELRAAEDEARAAQAADLRSAQQPIHPLRIYGDLVDVLGRDAIVICDGGDFASYAGQAIDRYEPGTWLDPGPFGCLGAGPGYALAAKLAHPDREVVILYGDGAFGFSAIEFDTLARHGVHVVGVMGNNGIWALEKHPMEFLYGYAVAADLTPETRYDQMVEALGGRGELVRDAAQLRPTLERALAPQDGPVLVNVLTDPETKYPRKANLG